MATTTTRAKPYTFAEPGFARWLFQSTWAAWIWLLVRLWVGWEWFSAGWGKVFGGDITWRPWRWDEASLTGDSNIGWVREGTQTFPGGDEVALGVGDAVAGFADSAIESAEGPHPDVAFDWYVDFLQWVRDTGHPFLGPVVAVGELVIGAALIVGLFTGLAAFVGATMNLSFVFAGAAGINPAMIMASIVLVLAWRNAGWIGLDRWALPFVGTPWQRGAAFEQAERRREPEPEDAERDREEAAATDQIDLDEEEADERRHDNISI